jgi:hypothetical protein
MVINMKTTYLNWRNRPFAEHSRFDSKIIRFYTSYFPCDGQNGIQSSFLHVSDNEFEYEKSMKISKG